MQQTPRLRIVSLVPSLTELLISLGLLEHVAGRSGFCVHPADLVKSIPKLGGTKDVMLDRLRELAPTHVLVNVDENRLETVREIESWPAPERPQIVVTHPQGPEDVISLIDQMVAVFGASAALGGAAGEQLRMRAERLQAELRAELAATTPAGRPEQHVLYLIWRRPWMTIARDTYISRMLERVGWRSMPAVVGGETGAGRYPVLEGEEPWLAGIDRVLLSSEPYSFTAAHLAEAQALCPGAQVQLVDGEALSWYGPRTAPGLRYLRGLADVRAHPAAAEASR